jgi:hypothetical protein
MRAYNNQRSDNRPLKRNDEEKRRALMQLEQGLAALGPKPTPGLRESMQAKIKALKEELASSAERKPSGGRHEP